MAESSAPGDFCFVHAADLHLDTPFKGVSLSAPHVGAALREASLDAFDRLVGLCLERDAAFLVLAGDIYDGAERGLRAQLRFRDGLERLSDAGIATFVVHGNHDPVEEGWSAISTWPDLVHVFGAGAVAAVPVVRDGVQIAIVQGVSYGRWDVTENLALGFSRQPGPGLQVGLLHCNVAGAADGYARYSPCTLSDLRSTGLDYWALGHIHGRMVLSGSAEGSEPWIVYSGNLQSRSPKASESGPKGAMVVEVRGGRVRHVEPVACDRVRFSRIALDIDGLDGLGDVRAELSALASAELAANEGRSLVLQGSLMGRGTVHRELAHESAVEELLQTLRDDCRQTAPFAWWDRLQVETAPALDLDELRRGDDFGGDLLRLADELSGGELDESDVAELLGKMPRDLDRLARELLGELLCPDLVRAAAIAALDLVEADQ
jgi:exonuclease SbcD